jgi:nitrile hydratase
MNGIHDMGGMTDFGPVRPEPNEPLFHAEWEARVVGMVRNIVDQRYNWDEFRFAIERLDPVVYLSTGYYERWLTALERFLLEKGLLRSEELHRTLDGWRPKPGAPLPDGQKPGESERSTLDRTTSRFKPGDRVVARNIHPAGHTRLPRYVRGKRGTVIRFLGMFTFPDTNALGLGQEQQPVYAVRFDAGELWGEQAAAPDAVCVDLWEDYLRPG